LFVSFGDSDDDFGDGDGDEDSTLRSFPVMKTNTATVSGEVVSVWFRFLTDEDKHSDGEVGFGFGFQL